MATRFWMYLDGGDVRLTLVQGQVLTVEQGGQTEEGYSWTTNRFELDGDTVYREVDTDARDCDGRLEHHASMFCRVDELDAHATDDGMCYPSWQVTDRSQRDHTAEAMGY